jgi:hypothetical protein
MNVSVPLYVLVAQWVTITALAWFIVLLYRQLAVDLHIDTRKDRKPHDQGIPIGSLGHAFQYRLAESPDTIREFKPARSLNLILFADPLCGTCERAVESLGKAAKAHDIEPLVLATSDARIIHAVEGFRNSPLTIGIIDPLVLNAYDLSFTPFAFVSDLGGIIRAKGPVQSVSDFASLLSYAKTGLAEAPIIMPQTLSAVASGGSNVETAQ